MTKEQLAEQLNGNEYRTEMTLAEEHAAKEAGLVVVFGYSDDNVEFRGAIEAEIYCFNGAKIMVHTQGVSGDGHECDCAFCGFEKLAKQCAVIEAEWCKVKPYLWTYKTSIPHATFDIYDEDGKFCRGIVFDVASLPVIK